MVVDYDRNMTIWTNLDLWGKDTFRLYISVSVSSHLIFDTSLLFVVLHRVGYLTARLLVLPSSQASLSRACGWLVIRRLEAGLFDQARLDRLNQGLQAAVETIPNSLCERD